MAMRFYFDLKLLNLFSEVVKKCCGKSDAMIFKSHIHKPKFLNDDPKSNANN